MYGIYFVIIKFMKWEENYSLLKNNTFGIDASCRYFFEYSSVDELFSFCADRGDLLSGALHIGGGSNLLFVNEYYGGLVVHSALKGIERVGETDDFVFVKAMSGVVWDDFVAYAVSEGLCGVENLSLIPGEVGAVPVQNIGAYGVEAKDVIDSVELFDVAGRRVLKVNADECGFAYRNSRFKSDWKGKYWVVSVTFRLKKKTEFVLDYGNIKSSMEGREVSLQSVRDTIIRIREEKLPSPEVLGSAGSFFMNPVVSADCLSSLKERFGDVPSYKLSETDFKVPAGWLIEQCGWKGKSYKRAGVYEKQALILVNRGGATGADVAELADIIVKDVKSKFGIDISPEVCYIK